MSDLPYKKYRFLQLGHPVQRVAWWMVWSLLFIPGMLLFRWLPGSRRKLPGNEPFLLLANHTSFFDPVWITYWLGRPSTYMASEVVFSKPFLKWILPLTGAFPKAFGKKDVAAMRNLTERYEAGDPVAFQIGENVLGFTFHPGFKLAIAEDLIMEFEESPEGTGPLLTRVGAMKREIEDALVPIMTGIVQIGGYMRG